MRLPLSSHRALRGFTLVELVIVIVITGVLAGTLVIFFTPAVESYFSTLRRAGITDQADTALRRMARDVRSAVPNSLRMAEDGRCFELLPTLTGGRYRMAPDSDNAASLALDTTQPSTGFDVLSPLVPVPAINDWVVVANFNANDAYQGSNRAAITAITSTPGGVLGEHRLSFAATQFPAGYDGGRFSIVPHNGGKQAVFYICDNAGIANGTGTGTLWRMNRPFVGAYPNACPAVESTAAIVATRVSRCEFTYSPSTSATQQNGFVSMLLELTDNRETVSLSFGTHVDNVP